MIRFSILLLGAWLCLLSNLEAHAFHHSVCEVEYNSQSKSIEVALRVNPIQLQRAISHQQKKKIDIDNCPNLEKFTSDYLAKKFVFSSAKEPKLKLSFVGMEMDLKYCWLYFEFPSEHGFQKLHLNNSLFTELGPEQHNLVHLREGVDIRSLRFSVQHQKLPLKKSTEQATSMKKTEQKQPSSALKRQKQSAQTLQTQNLRVS